MPFTNRFRGLIHAAEVYKLTDDIDNEDEDENGCKESHTDPS
jgi:hypothetical protein